MSLTTKRRSRGHEWTRFELHTMLCLIARGTHLENPAERNTNPYEKFATMLNEICSGKYGFDEDIDRREITGMLDQMLSERMHVVGRGGLLDRGLGGRVTRGLKRAWERGDYGDRSLGFNGSQAEWDAGRREKVMKAYKIERGLLPPDVEVNMDIDKEVQAPAVPQYAPTPTPNPRSSITSKVKKPSSSRLKTNATSSSNSTYLSRQLQGFEHAAKSSKWRGKQKENALSEAVVNDEDEMDMDPTPASTARPELENTNNLDSFSSLPDKLKKSGRFDWAKPGSPRPNLFVNEVAVKLKRPGLNARRSDVKAAGEQAVVVEQSVVEKDVTMELEEAKRRKRPGLNASRADTKRPAISIAISNTHNTTSSKSTDPNALWSDSGFGSSSISDPTQAAGQMSAVETHQAPDEDEEMQFAEEGEVDGDLFDDDEEL